MKNALIVIILLILIIGGCTETGRKNFKNNPETTTVTNNSNTVTETTPTEAETTNCGTCQYLENGTCRDYNCCENSQCAENKLCQEHICVNAQCTENQYIENHECKNYECIQDTDCPETKECLNHVCTLKQGCMFNNPTCNENEECNLNTCEPKQGCDYNSPECDENYTCVENVCVQQNQGCQYNNPTCGNNYDCIENQCVYNSCKAIGITCQPNTKCINGNCTTIPSTDNNTPINNTRIGCQYNNPSCNSNQNCTNNVCVLKTGCQYNNPTCSSNQNCINNQCVLKSGCVYNNPACSSNQTCVNNACVLKTGCQYNNPSCTSNQTCTNNTCNLKAGCQYNNPACQSESVCLNNSCNPLSACIPFIQNGNSQNKIDLVILPDDYLSDEELFSDDQFSFKTSITRFIDYNSQFGGLFSKEPFKSNKQKFNIWMVNTKDDKNCQILNDESINRCKNWSKEKSDLCQGKDSIAILSDDLSGTGGQGGYALTGYNYLVVTPFKNSRESARSAPEHYLNPVINTFVHEFGHSFGGLKDKYYTYDVYTNPADYPNCDSFGCPKWCSGTPNLPEPQYVQCAQITNQQACENANFNPSCRWAQIQGNWVCRGTFSEQNYGVSCLEGYECYQGCEGLNGYRAVYGCGIMFGKCTGNEDLNSLEFDIREKKVLSELLNNYN